MFRRSSRRFRTLRHRLPLLAVLAVLLAACAGWWHVRSPAEPSGTTPDAVATAPRAAQPQPAATPKPAAAQANAPATPEQTPAWKRLGVPAAPANGRPTIAIMIDDMGLNRVQSERAVHMPAPLTLSWMPYAQNVGEQAAAAATHGHETMLHMNMEALGHTDPGPDSLRTWLPAETNREYLRRALDRVPNAVGLNQHEGSVASLSVPLMDIVMDELKARGLLFIDSLTIPHSVALQRARAAGVATLPRNIFLDDSPDPAAIRAQLAAVEAYARRDGHVIAIGHPRPATMDALAAWLPTLTARGFVQWPVSATVAAAQAAQMAAKPASGPLPIDKSAGDQSDTE